MNGTSNHDPATNRTYIKENNPYDQYNRYKKPCLP